MTEWLEWPGADVRLRLARGTPPCEEVTGRFDGHVIGVHLDAPARVEQWREGARFVGVYAPDALTLIPAGCTATCTTRVPTSFVHVELSRRWIASIQGVGGEPPSRFRYEDEVTALVAKRAAHEARRLGPAARLFVEAAALVLADRTRILLAEKLATRTPRLDPRALARTLAFLVEHAGRNPGVSELADVADVSPFHFSRMFRRATGMSPHRYVNRLRIERARTLLGTTSMAIAEVGAEIGFGNPSHFTVFFRRELGSTPLAYRRAVRRA